MKNIIRILLWSFIFLSLFGISYAFADNSCMRCSGGREMVCIGTPASTVLAKCGEPLSRNVIGSKTNSHSRGTVSKGQVTRDGRPVLSTSKDKSSTTMNLEEWTYCIYGSYGNDCYLYILRFSGDSLSKITSTMQKGN